MKYEILAHNGPFVKGSLLLLLLDAKIKKREDGFIFVFIRMNAKT